MPAQVASPEALEYRRVQAVGRFLHDRELYLAGRSSAGKSGSRCASGTIARLSRWGV